MLSPNLVGVGQTVAKIDAVDYTCCTPGVGKFCDFWLSSSNNCKLYAVLWQYSGRSCWSVTALRALYDVAWSSSIHGVFRECLTLSFMFSAEPRKRSSLRSIATTPRATTLASCSWPRQLQTLCHDVKMLVRCLSTSKPNGVLSFGLQHRSMPTSMFCQLSAI